MSRIHAIRKKIIDNGFHHRNIIILSVFFGLTLLSLYVRFSQNRWGLYAQYYNNREWNGTPVVKRIEKNPYIRGKAGENILSASEFSVKWKGFLRIPRAGIYQFKLNSDDGSYLRIDGNLIIDNGGIHGLQGRSQEIILESGMHAIEILYFQIGGYNIVELLWTPPQEHPVFIPHTLLFAKRPTWVGVYWREGILRLPHILPIAWIVFGFSVVIHALIIYVKKTSFRCLLQNIGVSIASITIVFGMAELVSRVKYTPQAIDYSWIFEYDKDKLFRLKANHAGEYGGVKITTNSFGYRDHEITIKKPANAFRIIVLGDSITFGHGDVLQHELYTEVLETTLRQHFLSATIDVMNMGCPGNSAQQEYYDLKQGLEFQPDLVIVQYTLNDVTEPYLVAKKHGGEGKDYHGVEDIPYVDYILSQHSAFYLFLKDLRTRLAFQSLTKEDVRKKAMEREVFHLLDNLVTYHDHPQITQAWNEYLAWLQKIVDLCHANSIPCKQVSEMFFKFLSFSILMEMSRSP